MKIGTYQFRGFGLGLVVRLRNFRGQRQVIPLSPPEAISNETNIAPQTGEEIPSVISVWTRYGSSLVSDERLEAVQQMCTYYPSEHELILTMLREAVCRLDNVQEFHIAQICTDRLVGELRAARGFLREEGWRLIAYRDREGLAGNDSPDVTLPKAIVAKSEVDEAVVFAVASKADVSAFLKCLCPDAGFSHSLETTISERSLHVDPEFVDSVLTQIEEFLAGQENFDEGQVLDKTLMALMFDHDPVLLSTELLSGAYRTESSALFRCVTRLCIWYLRADFGDSLRLFNTLAGRLLSQDRAYLANYVIICAQFSDPHCGVDMSMWLTRVTWWSQDDIQWLRRLSGSIGNLTNADVEQIVAANLTNVPGSLFDQTGASGIQKELAQQIFRCETIRKSARITAALSLIVSDENIEALRYLQNEDLSDQIDSIGLFLNLIENASPNLEQLAMLFPILVQAVQKNVQLEDRLISVLSSLRSYALVSNLTFELSREPRWHGLRESIQPAGQDGARSLDEIRSIGNTLLISDLDLSLEDLSRCELPIKTYFSLRGFEIDGEKLTGGASVLRGTDLNDDQKFMRELTHLSEVVSESLTHQFISSFSASYLEGLLADLESAIFASVRARIIGKLRQFEIRNYWQRFAGAFDQIVLFTDSTSTAQSVIDSIDDEVSKKKLRVCFLPSQGLKFTHQLAWFTQEIDHEDALPVYPRPPVLSMVPVLKDVYERFTPVIQPGNRSETTLFICRLSAKTVPGTVYPVIQKLLQEGDVHLLDIQTSKDDTVATTFAQNSPHTLYRTSSRDLRKQALQISKKALGKKNKDVLEIWFRHHFAQVGRTLLGEHTPRYFDLLHKEGVGFEMANFAYLLAVRKNLKLLMDSSKTRVVASPGRSVEAYCGQTMAGLRNYPSIEVVNAWLSDEYTYARPRGDVVTALDSWTAELLQRHFAIPEECVETVGTPRYDGLFKRAAQMDRQSLAKKFALEPDLPTICVALQPIAIGINDQILDGVLSALDENFSANVLFKPHPRELSERLEHYRGVIEAHKSSASSNLKLIPTADIIETLVASDLCVTAFSNVGVEAALCQRDTLLCQFDGMTSPIRLDEMGLGYATYSPVELRDAVRDVLRGGGIRALVREARSGFFAKNMHFVEGDATQRILSLIDDERCVGRGLDRPWVIPQHMA